MHDVFPFSFLLFDWLVFESDAFSDWLEMLFDVEGTWANTIDYHFVTVSGTIVGECLQV